jgi:DNA-binding CsgD family transcriptional regulator
LRSGTEAATAGIAFGPRLEAALEETDDPSLVAEIQVTGAQLATLAGDPDFAADLLRSHGEAIIAASPSLGAVLTALAGSCAWMRGDGAATRALAEQAVALVGGQVTADMAPIANFVIRAGAATGYDDPALAVSTARMIRERGQTNLAGSALFCLMVADQIAEADAFYRWAIVAARDAGSIADVAWLHGPATLLLCRQGHFEAAYAAGSEAIDLAHFVLGPFPLAQAHSALAYVSAVRGDRARCEQHVAETRRLATTDHIQIAWLAARHAGALALLGDRLTDAALTELELLAADLERHHICGVTIFPTMPELAETQARTGRTSEARATRDTWRRRVGVDLSTLKAATLARLDALCAQSIDECDAYFATAEALFAEVPYPFELARTHLYRGERLRRGRRRRDAAKELYEARAGFEELGARAWCAQADAELRALGLRPKATTSTSGLPGETLSPQEYQVAMAASGGAATRDIAASLFISPKTVEAHLTRIYRKLGVSSKAQLVAAVGSTGWPASDGATA